MCGTLVCAVAAAVSPADAAGGSETEDGHRTSRISDESAPRIDPDTMPSRPKPILELGNPFLGTGNIEPGFELPTGAMWQPSLMVFGTYRTAIQTFDDGEDGRAEWTQRLDLFANTQFSGTERLLIGIRPLDQGFGEHFTQYNFTDSAGEDSKWQDATNIDLTTAFFEGDLGEIFPDLDPTDTAQLDWGFSVGRQPLFYQEGMLINDTVDAVGITRNTLQPAGMSDMQITFLYGWNEIDRDDNLERNGEMYGIFTAFDLPFTTLNVDVVQTIDDEDGDDGTHWGASGVQRIGHTNTSFRYLGSQARNDETAAMSSGHLLFTEVSWAPPWTDDNMYINAFWGIDQFASAARSPETGGPLGRTGILFAAVGLGRYGAALGNRVDDSVGGAVGYQAYLDEGKRKQLIVELGGRQSTVAEGDADTALGGRYQQAFGQHMVLQWA